MAGGKLAARKELELWLRESAAKLCKLFHVEQFDHWSQIANGRIKIDDLLTNSKVPFKNI
jgi:hypothetical protein